MKAVLIYFWLFLSIIMSDNVSADEDKSEIGVLLPLSGELAAVGTAVSNGIAVAIEKNPDRFDKIKFIYEDSRYDAKVTLSVFQTMTRRKNMKLLYVWGSQTCMPVVPIAEKEHFPLVCFSGDPKPGLRYVISFNSPLADYASRITEHVRSIGSSQIAIVYSEIPFYENLAVAFEEQIKPVAFTYREGFLPSTQDFSTIAKKLKSKDFQALALFLLPHQLPTMLKRMIELNYSPTIVGTDNFAELEANKNTQGILDQASYVDMVIDPDFASAYIKKYGNKSNLSFAYNGYYFALAMADSLKGNKSILTSEELISELRDYKDADSGVIFKEDPNFGQYFSFPIELKKVISSEKDPE
jgi:ABC-type branched-subunit amino acid transport system substrate-binding protein